MYRLFFALNIFTVFCFAEQIAILPDGNKIRVLEDGTWKSVENSIKSDTSISVLFDSSCSALIETRSDKMSGNSYIVSKEPIIVAKDRKDGLVITLMNGSKGGIIFGIKAIGAGNCIDEGDKINILFTDKSRLELASDSKYNCDAKATIYFGGAFGKKAQLRELLSKRISAVRVWTNDSYVEEEFSKDNADTFYYTIRCLAISLK